MPGLERLRTLGESANLAELGGPAGPPVVRVTIGRVEIRGTPTPQSSVVAAPVPASAPRLTLAEYLSGKKTTP